MSFPQVSHLFLFGHLARIDENVMPKLITHCSQLRQEHLTMKEIETKLTEHHLARTNSTANAICRSGLFCFKPVVLT